jgi:hypothetical protein
MCDLLADVGAKPPSRHPPRQKGNMSFHDSDDNMSFHDSDDNTDDIGEMPAADMALPPQMSSSAYCDYLPLPCLKIPATVNLAAL